MQLQKDEIEQEDIEMQRNAEFFMSLLEYTIAVLKEPNLHKITSSTNAD